MTSRFERLRGAVATDRPAAAALLAGLDTDAATPLVRAFTLYFHLANIGEQVHRARELAAVRRARGTWLSQAVDRIAAAGHAPAEVAADVHDLGLRPVFTAHPTEAARRTVLTKLRGIAGLLDAWERALGADRRPGGGAARAPPARGARRAAVADRRAALRAARGHRRGPQRGLLLRLACTATWCRRCSRQLDEELGRLGRRAAARRSPAALRLLDRRRPRRQPQRHGRDDARRSSRCSTTTRSATPRRWSSGWREDALDVRTDRRCEPPRSRPRSPPTSRRSRGSIRAAGG